MISTVVNVRSLGMIESMHEAIVLCEDTSRPRMSCSSSAIRLRVSAYSPRAFLMAASRFCLAAVRSDPNSFMPQG